MKILWCDAHGQAEFGEGLCVYGRVGGLGDCRMVPMRLIPDNALRRRIGQALVRYIDPERSPTAIVDMTDDLLVALDGETP